MDASHDSDDFQVLSESWVDLSPHLCDTSGFFISDTTAHQILYDHKQVVVDQQDKRSTGSSSSIEVLQQSPFSSRNSSPLLSGMLTPDNETSIPSTDIPFSEDLLPCDNNYDGTNDRAWVLGWSSQPINQPPRRDMFKHPKKRRYYSLSLRKTEAMRNGLSNTQIFYIIVPSLIISNFIAFGLGFYLGRNIHVPPCEPT